MSREILQKTINTHGVVNQMVKTVEELSELSQALCKATGRWLSGTKGSISDDLKSVDNLFEEIADVEIMLEQCKMMFHCDKEVNEWKTKKLNRLLVNLLPNSVLNATEDGDTSFSVDYFLQVINQVVGNCSRSKGITSGIDKILNVIKTIPCESGVEGTKYANVFFLKKCFTDPTFTKEELPAVFMIVDIIKDMPLNF